MKGRDGGGAVVSGSLSCVRSWSIFHVNPSSETPLAHSLSCSICCLFGL